MPLRQYVVLKKAIDFETLNQRRTYIYDTNRAFHDPKPLFQQLEKEEQKLLSTLKRNKKETSNTISWGKDPDWQIKAMKYQA